MLPLWFDSQQKEKDHQNNFDLEIADFKQLKITIV
jgi:hypothetical protein